MFNPHPRVSQVPIGDGRTCVVVDDFFSDPHALRALAIEHASGFARAEANAFPGVELPMPAAFCSLLDEFFMQHARRQLGARRTIELHSRLAMVALPPRQLRPIQRVCHRDRMAVAERQMAAACVAYLFDDPRMGGTSFFRPRRPAGETEALMRALDTMSDAEADRVLGADPGYMIDSNDWFELVRTVPAAWNRAIFYDGSVFHTSHIGAPDKLSDDPAAGRLTLNGFFVCQKQAA